MEHLGMITCNQWDPPVDVLGLLEPFTCCAGLRQASETIEVSEDGGIPENDGNLYHNPSQKKLKSS